MRIEKLSTFVAGRTQPVLGRERMTILQTFNPAQPDFNMRQHIARCTLRPSLEVQALKVSPERSFGRGKGSPKSNLLKYSCHEEKNAGKKQSRAQSARRPTGASLLSEVEQ